MNVVLKVFLAGGPYIGPYTFIKAAILYLLWPIQN